MSTMSNSFPSIPNVLSSRWVRRSISLAKYPSRTFDGTTPSASIKAKHFVWSTIAKTFSMGSRVLFNSSTLMPTCSAIFIRASVRFAVSSKLIIPETSATFASSFASI